MLNPLSPTRQRVMKRSEAPTATGGYPHAGKGSPDPTCRHLDVLLNVKRETFLRSISLFEAARCCSRARADKLNQAQLVLVSVSTICVGVFEDCRWSPCRHRPHQSEFIGREADESKRVKYVGRMIPEECRTRAVLQLFWTRMALTVHRRRRIGGQDNPAQCGV